jgi:hypothetical protein
VTTLEDFLVSRNRRRERVVARDRAWRNASANAARPLVSDKVAYYNPKVTVGVVAKPVRRSK